MIKRIYSVILFSIRQSASSPMNTIMCIFVLAGSIALVTSMFGICSMLMLSQLPYKDADKMVTFTRIDRRDYHMTAWNFASYRILEENSTDFVKYHIPTLIDSFHVQKDSRGYNYTGSYIRADYEKILGIAPIKGRSFTTDDALATAEPTVVISERLWNELFQRAPDAIGKVIRIEGVDRTVIGVMPDIFSFPYRSRLWIPLNIDTLYEQTGWANYVLGYAVLKDGVSLEQAEERYQTIFQRTMEELPEENVTIVSAELMPLDFTSSNEKILFGSMFGCTFLVLLMGCGIVSGLLTARYSYRSQELAIRSALGASRLQLVTQMILEFITLSVSSLILGILLSRCLDTMLLGQYLDRFDLPEFMIQGRNVLMAPFSIVVLLIITLVSTILPALRASRTDLSSILRDSTRTGSSLRITRLSSFLICWQVATACVVMCGGCIIGYSLYSFSRECRFIEPSDYVGATLAFNSNKHNDANERSRLVRDIMEALRRNPDIEKATASTEFFNYFQWGSAARVYIPSEEYPSESDVPMTVYRIVPPGHFDATNVPIGLGRDFTWEDTDTGEVVVVTDEFAMEHFGTLDVIGEKFGMYSPDNQLTIIGVVPDMYGDIYKDKKYAAVYCPYSSSAWYDLNLLIKGTGNLSTTSKAIEETISRIDPDISISDITSFDKFRADKGRGRFLSFIFVLFMIFSAGTIFIAVAGLYGTISFSINMRKRETGIRMALGAGPARIALILAKRGIISICIGMAVGLAGTIVIRQIIKTQLSPIPENILVYLATIGALLIVCLISVIIPAAWGALRDPAKALHT